MASMHQEADNTCIGLSTSLYSCLMSAEYTDMHVAAEVTICIHSNKHGSIFPALLTYAEACQRQIFQRASSCCS